MRFFTFFIAALLLSACNTPSGEFRGIAPTRITVQGATFEVRQNAGWAEAIRVNVQYAPRFGSIQGKAGLAMARVTGCEVVEVTGDQAQARGRLDCGNGPPPKRATPVDLDCAPVYGSGVEVLDGILVEVDCRRL